MKVVFTFKKRTIIGKEVVVLSLVNVKYFVNFSTYFCLYFYNGLKSKYYKSRYILEAVLDE